MSVARRGEHRLEGREEPRSEHGMGEVRLRLRGALDAVAARRLAAPEAPELREHEPHVVALWNLSADELAAGNARASLRLPPDLSPSFDGADLRLGYVVRVLVDRRFMPDTAIERPVAIA